MEASKLLSTAPLPSLVLFARGVIARLAIWPALRIAVTESWGGPGAPEKRKWLASAIVDSFEEEDPVPDVGYVEQMLLQIMADEFDTILEDGSAEDVAKDIVKLWDDSIAGRQGLMLDLETQAEKVKGKKLLADEGMASDEEKQWTDDEDDDESGDEAPKLLPERTREREEPMVDEDGFTLVKGKGKKLT
jgi:pre-rRNA-processing protein TSR2